MKVVIDTNIWISYLLGGLLRELDEKIISGKVKVVVSEVMLKEFGEVINRPKFNALFTRKRVKELFALLDNYAIVVSPKKKVNVCRDPKDNFLLEIALEGQVDCLVTGDDDLLVLDSFHNIRILRPADFREVLLKISE
jgi:putative PIN family toxin of toxin-antitoxin system